MDNLNRENFYNVINPNRADAIKEFNIEKAVIEIANKVDEIIDYLNLT